MSKNGISKTAKNPKGAGRPRIQDEFSDIESVYMRHYYRSIIRGTLKDYYIPVSQRKKQTAA